MNLQQRLQEVEDAKLQALANYQQLYGRAEELKYLIQQDELQKAVDSSESVPEDKAE